MYTEDLNNNSSSGIAAISDTSFLLLERDGNFQGGIPAATHKRFYQFSIAKATDVSDPEDKPSGKLYAGGTKTLEQLTEAELAAENIVPALKTLVSDLLTDLPYYPHDKLEGVAILNDSMIIVSNDDDFGVLPNTSGTYDQKYLPLNQEEDVNTLYYVRLRTKLSNLGGKVDDVLTSTQDVFFPESKQILAVYPNPSQEMVYFSKTVRKASLVNLLGAPVQFIEEADDLYVGHLAKGIYVLKTADESVKLIIR